MFLFVINITIPHLLQFVQKSSKIRLMTITIPQKLTHGKELVIIPREEYDELVELRKIYEFKPTIKHKKILEKARKNRREENILTLRELKNDVAPTD